MTKHWQWSQVHSFPSVKVQVSVNIPFLSTGECEKNTDNDHGSTVSHQSECRYQLKVHFHQQVNMTKHWQWSRGHNFPSVREQLPGCQITHYGCVKVVPHTTFLPNSWGKLTNKNSPSGTHAVYDVDVGISIAQEVHNLSVSVASSYV